MSHFERGDRVLIMFNPYDREMPIGRGQVIEVRGDGLIEIQYGTEGRIACFLPGLLVNAEKTGQSDLDALRDECLRLSKLYALFAVAAEDSGELGHLRRALMDFHYRVFKNADGSYTAEGAAVRTSGQFRVRVLRRLRRAGFTVLDPHVVLDKSRPFGPGPVYRITFRVEQIAPTPAEGARDAIQS